jgi:hypothetical protein
VPDVVRLVHDRHATLTKLPLDLVAIDQGSRETPGWSCHLTR